VASHRGIPPLWVFNRPLKIVFETRYWKWFRESFSAMSVSMSPRKFCFIFSRKSVWNFRLQFELIAHLMESVAWKLSWQSNFKFIFKFAVKNLWLLFKVAVRWVWLSMISNTILKNQFAKYLWFVLEHLCSTPSFEIYIWRVNQGYLESSVCENCTRNLFQKNKYFLKNIHDCRFFLSEKKVRGNSLDFANTLETIRITKISSGPKIARMFCPSQ